MLSIHKELEQAKSICDINMVRERIELEIDVEDAKRGYNKSCDVLESIFKGQAVARNAANVTQHDESCGWLKTGTSNSSRKGECDCILSSHD